MSRAAYSDEPRLLEEVFALLEATWSGWFAEQARAGARWGLDWAACSTPFVARVDGQVVSHVGVLECETLLAGERVTVGGIHGVATHPDYRGQGHYGELVGQALEFAEARHPTLVLTTEAPALYEGLGFEVVQEHRFTADVEVQPRPACESRILDASRPEDVALLQRCFAEREPLSRVCSPLRADVFYFVEARSPLRHVPELDAVLRYAVEDRCLHLVDVVAPRMPSLGQVLAAVPEDVARVVCYFEPGKLSKTLTAEPHTLRGNDHLMVKGAWPPLDAAFMWPPSMRW